MCDLYRSGLLLEDVAQNTGFCVTTVRKFLVLNGCTIRHRGKRLGTGKVQTLDDAHLIKFKSQWDRLPSTMKGTIAETYTKTRLAEIGCEVWEPFGQNHVTDILVIVRKRICRIQVKSATYDTRTKAFRANVTRHKRDGEMRSYTLNDADFFIIYCGGLEALVFYVIPASLIIGRSDVKLYPHRPKGPLKGKSVDWSDYINAFHLIYAAP